MPCASTPCSSRGGARDLDCTAGTQEYDLPSDVGDIYRVLEVGLIQAGEVHPLQMVTPLSPRMFGGGRYCAVMTANIEDTDNEFAILVAEPVATGDVLQVTVACSWPIRPWAAMPTWCWCRPATSKR